MTSKEKIQGAMIKKTEVNFKMKISVTVLALIITLINIREIRNSFAERIPENIIDLCKKQKESFECDRNCVDGFDATAYYDSTKYTLPEYGDIYLSKEEKEASFGIHSQSRCGECYNKFELKMDGKFKEVSCEEFFQTIEEKNKSCNSCVRKISRGCC